MPSPSYNLASIPVIAHRYPLHDDPDLPVRIARGEGFLGNPIRGRRETLSVRTADGAPDYIIVFASNTVLPFLMAVVTSLVFLLPVF